MIECHNFFIFAWNFNSLAFSRCWLNYNYSVLLFKYYPFYSNYCCNYWFIIQLFLLFSSQSSYSFSTLQRLLNDRLAQMHRIVFNFQFPLKHSFWVVFERVSAFLPHAGIPSNELIKTILSNQVNIRYRMPMHLSSYHGTRVRLQVVLSWSASPTTL